VIHRDVKPGNVLIGRDGRARLVDFGIARSLADASARLTMTGTVMGTLHAMAPEQLADEPITPRTDLYGLGVVLHEMVTGSAPYAATSPVALAAAQRAGPPSLEGVDAGLAAVIAACLAPDPAARPLHAGALAAALRDWLAGDPAGALAMRPLPAPAADGGIDRAAVTRAMARAAPVGDAAPPVAPARREVRRRSLVPVLLLALVAVVGAAAMAAMASDRPVADAPSSPTASTSSTPARAWVDELAAAVAEACGTDPVAVAAALEGLDEEEARDAADAAIDRCADDDAESGGTGKGKGKGKGRDNGNGRGNGD
jgi:serine/threonine-protein kinase